MLCHAWVNAVDNLELNEIHNFSDSSSEDDFRFNWFHANYTKIEGNEMYTVDNGNFVV